ncbi:MAG: PAS domain-containing protein [Candidatus Omnitrophica bacterium]|nr:PAS domain-containing protein [Candidatus Omnitrophota bacterium]
MANNKQSKLKIKVPAISKKVKKPVSKNSALKAERRNLLRRASDKDKTPTHLGKVLLQQSQDLKLKNRQIKKWVERNDLAEEQVYILTKAMESAVDGIFLIDAQKQDYPIVYTNKSFQKMTGYTKNEILGKNYFLLYGVDSDPLIINKIKRAMRKGKSFIGEVLNFNKAGKKCWNSLRLSPVHDLMGEVSHYVGIKTDITLMRQRELKIEEQRHELLHVTRVGKLAEFVSSLAHEISQPLTAILAYAQAAQRMLKSKEPKLKEALECIINDDKRAAAVIQRLRSLLKKGVSEMKPLDINTLINDTVMLIATDAAVRHDVLKLELKNELPLICGDQIQLQQVILNLISNSFDALDNGQQIREIIINTSVKDNMIIVEVRDTGCGIPVKNLPKLFTRFFTSKQDGLGMGLSISRSIVESHGGKLNVKNNPDGGAIFYFSLPIKQKAEV